MSDPNLYPPQQPLPEKSLVPPRAMSGEYGNRFGEDFPFFTMGTLLRGDYAAVSSRAPDILPEDIATPTHNFVGTIGPESATGLISATRVEALRLNLSHSGIWTAEPEYPETLQYRPQLERLLLAEYAGDTTLQSVLSAYDTDPISLRGHRESSRDFGSNEVQPFAMRRFHNLPQSPIIEELLEARAALAQSRHYSESEILALLAEMDELLMTQSPSPDAHTTTIRTRTVDPLKVEVMLIDGQPRRVYRDSGGDIYFAEND
jgi:hypothetical protein